mgnify:CR=1 FL=1
MKRTSFTAIICAAVMLTGCASQNSTAPAPAEPSTVGTAPGISAEPGTSAADSTSAGTSAASVGSSLAEEKPDHAPDTSAGTTAASVPGTSAAPVSEPEKPAATSGGTSAPEKTSAPMTTRAPEHSDPVGGDYKGTDIGGTGKSSDDYMYDIAEDAPAADGFFAEADVVGVAGGAMDSGYGYVECPEPFPYTWEAEPEIPPEAGLLTGGEWNDNDHWDFWEGLYYSNNYGVDWSGYREEWRTGLDNRISVTVKDSCGAPVSGAEVQGIGYSAVTDSDGRAYLFCKDSQLAGDPSDFEVTYDGGSQTFSEIVSGDSEFTFTLDGEAKPAAKTLDLMIMCDTTGSMGDELEYLKAELEDVVTRIKQENANIPVRISVNFYRDEGDEYVVREFPFTTDLDAAVRAISEQSADGGGDTPEAVHTALDSAVNSHDWDEDSIKVMFLVLDAPPHGDVQIIDEVVKHTRTAAEKGIRIVPVAASGVDKSCEYLLRSMAIMTGGTYTFLTDDSGIGFSHTEPTIGAYDVEKLNDMMVRIAGEYIG